MRQSSSRVIFDRRPRRDDTGECPALVAATH